MPGTNQQLDRLQSRHQADHFASPQEVEQVRQAIAAVEHGLELLGRLGHRYHLAPGAPPETDDWPRLMFHVEAAPNGRVVASQYAAYELGPDWYPTLAEAQHAEGVRAQFAGRGGVGSRSVPMLVGAGPGPQPETPLQPKDNSAVIEAWRREKQNGYS